MLLFLDFMQVVEPEAGSDGYYVPPAKGQSAAELWARNSQLPGDHVIAGSFDSAMRVSAGWIFVCWDGVRGIFVRTVVYALLVHFLDYA